MNDDHQCHQEENGSVARMMARALKSCNHYCYPSILDKCCSCEDLRPIVATNSGYECYVDGVGYTTTAARDDGYCPVCNTKNYDKWMERVRNNTTQKRREDDERNQWEKEQARMAEQDRVRHSEEESGRIDYTNGNIYVGDLLNGEPHGLGRMDYADNEYNILSYQGEWEHGKHEGQGKKLWMDDVYYEGSWVDGMMHGTGYFRMNEVEALDGEFEKDEFCG